MSSKSNKTQLKNLIKEVVSSILKEYERSVIRVNNDIFIVDDDGNEELLGDVEDYPEYDHLEDGGYGMPLDSRDSPSRRRYRERY